MITPSIGEIDRELASRTAEAAVFAEALVDLDNHPGLEHVRRYLPTGVTAQRWTAVEKSLAQLWEDMGCLTSILESARKVRGRRSMLDDDDRTELASLLREGAHELSRGRIPRRPRLATESIGAADGFGIPDIVERIRGAYSPVVEFLDAVDEIDSLIAVGLGPLHDRLDEAGVQTPKEIAELLAVSATDPLSLSVVDVEERIRAIAVIVERRADDLAELNAMKRNWPDAVAETAQRLDEFRDATQRAAQIRACTEKTVIAGPLPACPDTEPTLRAELTSFTTPDAAALRTLRHRIERALEDVREIEKLAQGLLDRRAELEGRLSGYEAKAARLGLGEERDLLACSRIASGLLSRRPCDLRVATRAVTDYQQMLVEKRGKPR